jgi:hypothetical protein
MANPEKSAEWLGVIGREERIHSYQPRVQAMGIPRRIAGRRHDGKQCKL